MLAYLGLMRFVSFMFDVLLMFDMLYDVEAFVLHVFSLFCVWYVL